MSKPFTSKVEEQIDNDYRGHTYVAVYGATRSTVVTDDNISTSENLLNLKIFKVYIFILRVIQ